MALMEAQHIDVNKLLQKELSGQTNRSAIVEPIGSRDTHSIFSNFRQLEPVQISVGNRHLDLHPGVFNDVTHSRVPLINNEALGRGLASAHKSGNLDKILGSLSRESRAQNPLKSVEDTLGLGMMGVMTWPDKKKKYYALAALSTLLTACGGQGVMPTATEVAPTPAIVETIQPKTEIPVTPSPLVNEILTSTPVVAETIVAVDGSYPSKVTLLESPSVYSFSGEDGRANMDEVTRVMFDRYVAELARTGKITGSSPEALYKSFDSKFNLNLYQTDDMLTRIIQSKSDPTLYLVPQDSSGATFRDLQLGYDYLFANGAQINPGLDNFSMREVHADRVGGVGAWPVFANVDANSVPVSWINVDRGVELPIGAAATPTSAGPIATESSTPVVEDNYGPKPPDATGEDSKLKLYTKQAENGDTLYWGENQWMELHSPKTENNLINNEVSVYKVDYDLTPFTVLVSPDLGWDQKIQMVDQSALTTPELKLLSFTATYELQLARIFGIDPNTSGSYQKVIDLFDQIHEGTKSIQFTVGNVKYEWSPKDQYEVRLVPKGTLSADTPGVFNTDSQLWTARVENKKLIIVEEVGDMNKMSDTDKVEKLFAPLGEIVSHGSNLPKTINSFSGPIVDARFFASTALKHQQDPGTIKFTSE